MAVPGRDVLVSGLRVCHRYSTSMLGFAVLRVFNVSSDILVIGVGVSQPLGGSEVMLNPNSTSGTPNQDNSLPLMRLFKNILYRKLKYNYPLANYIRQHFIEPNL